MRLPAGRTRSTAGPTSTPAARYENGNKNLGVITSGTIRQAAVGQAAEQAPGLAGDPRGPAAAPGRSPIFALVTCWVPAVSVVADPTA